LRKTPPMSASTLPVGIIGGGPCGLLASLLLARAGVSAVIFEKKEGISTHPKAMGVSRRSAEIFRQIGLLDRLAEGSLPTAGYSLSFWGKSLPGEELGRVPLHPPSPELTPCSAMHTPQTWTEEVLLEAARKEPLATLRFAEEAVAVEEAGGRVRITVASGGTEEFSWVIAADGAGSGVRHQLGIETVGPGEMGRFINVMFRAPFGGKLGDRKAILYQVLTEEAFEPFVAVDGKDLWLMHHFLQPGEKVEDYSKERFAEIISYVSGFPDAPVEVLGLSPWVMSPKVAKKFRTGRIFLVGDAAARLSPAGGLGLNTGLQSVHNLAWKLAAVVRGEAGEALLDSYESERKTASFATMQNTNSNAEEIWDIIGAGFEGKWDIVRDRIAHSRRGGAGLGQDLGVRYEAGAFLDDGLPAPEVNDAINDYLPVARPGSRAPHLWITQKGEKKSLLDLLGGRFVLLAGRSASEWAAPSGVSVLRNGADFETVEFEQAYGIAETGAVLIRPDGYVAARFAEAPADPALSVARALDLILACRQ